MQMHGRYMKLYNGMVLDADEISCVRNQQYTHSRVGNCEIRLKHTAQDCTNDYCIYTDAQEGQQIMQALLDRGDREQAYIDEVTRFCRKHVQNFY